MNTFKKNNHGFSLIELIIVIAIMAIIIAVLAPQFLRYIEKSRQGKDADTAGVVKRAITIAMVDNTIVDRPSSFSGDLTLLDDGTRPVFVQAIKDYLGNYDFGNFKRDNIKSNAYKASPVYIDIDSNSELVRVTLSSNAVGVEDIVIE